VLVVPLKLPPSTWNKVPAVVPKVRAAPSMVPPVATASVPALTAVLPM
jgi:hypothetical protein